MICILQAHPRYKALGYVAHGYVYASMDSRGQGGLSEDIGGAVGTTCSTPFIRGLDDKPENMYQRNLFLDTAIMAQVVMVTGFMDTICPPSTQFAMYNKLICEKESVIYPDYGHEDIIDMEDRIFEFMRSL